MRTSVNLLLADIPKLIKACLKCKMKHSALINLCLRKFFAAHPEILDKSRASRTVEYQPKGAGYSIVTLVFEPEVFNLSLFFRAFCRVSVSAMVSMALACFLDQVVRECEDKENNLHNYVDYQLLMRHNLTTNMPEWSINWELEEQTRTT